MKRDDVSPSQVLQSRLQLNLNMHFWSARLSHYSSQVKAEGKLQFYPRLAKIDGIVGLPNMMCLTHWLVH